MPATLKTPKTEGKTTPFIQNVGELSQRLNRRDDPSWLVNLRKQGTSSFRALGIPTVKDEDWKYTNLSGLAAKKYHLMEKVQFTEKARLNVFCDPNEITVVFINGFLSPEFSNLKSLPAGLTLLDLHDAVKSNQSDMEALLAKYDQHEEGSFIALNKALTNEGVFIKVKEKAVVEKVIHIIHVTQTANAAMTAPRAIIILEKSSEATVLESHLAFHDDSDYCSVPLTDVYLTENATLHYCKAQDESHAAFHIGTTRVWQERNSNFDGFSLMTGGNITRNNLDVIVNGEGSSSILNGFYGTNQKQHVDNHSTVDHRVPNCTSNQLYKGILNGQSHTVFNGKIFVRQIAQQTNSYQLNKNLILGTDCRVDTKPQLEIFADDVKCTHGATIGQLNEEEIFYLQSRAIPKKSAVKLLARGFVDETLDKIVNPAIIKKLNILLEPTFAAIE